MTKFGFPQICQNPDNLPPLQRKVFDNIAELQKRDLLDPQSNEHDKKTFLAQFVWSRSALNPDQISGMQNFSVRVFRHFGET